MGKRRKKKSSTPRHKRMNRPRRLQAAKHWIPKYEGKNLVAGYSKHFAVDKLCAVSELEMLGYSIKGSYKKQLKEAARQKQRESEKRKRLKREKQLENEWIDSDETFAFIVDYTPWGFPFGITWEEWEEIEKAERESEKNEFEKGSNEKEQSLNREEDELPF